MSRKLRCKNCRFLKQVEFGLEPSPTNFYRKWKLKRTIWQICCHCAEPQVSEKYKKNFDALMIRLPIKGKFLRGQRFVTIDNLQLEHDCKNFKSIPPKKGDT